MAAPLVLMAEPRTALGKKNGALRRTGKIPGVVYGPAFEPTIQVQVDTRDSSTSGLWPNIKQSVLPVTVLALANSASLTRFVRASMLEVINQDFVRTARAKGLTERVVIIFHAMRNAMIPVVTILALQIPEVFGGAIITEQIFRVPGIGSLLIESIASADHPVVMGIAMGIAVLVVIFNVIADLIYALLDPRIKLA